MTRTAAQTTQARHRFRRSTLTRDVVTIVAAERRVKW